MTAFLRALVVSTVALVVFFTPPHSLFAQGTISTTQTFCLGTSPCVWTYHNNNSRGGVNPNETRFTPSWFASNTFSATTVATDGLIYAQLLYISGLTGANGNVGSSDYFALAQVEVR